MFGVLAAVEARVGVKCRGLGVFTSVGEPGGTTSQENLWIFVDGSPDCCWLCEPTFLCQNLDTQLSSPMLEVCNAYSYRNAQ
jgi:hypothetical protein